MRSILPTILDRVTPWGFAACRHFRIYRLIKHTGGGFYRRTCFFHGVRLHVQLHQIQHIADQLALSRDPSQERFRQRQTLFLMLVGMDDSVYFFRVDGLSKIVGQGYPEYPSVPAG